MFPGPNSPEYEAAGPEGHQRDQAENIQRQGFKSVEAQPAPSSMFSHYRDEDN